MSPRWWDAPGPGDENAPAEMERLECRVCEACDGCRVCEGHGLCDACGDTGCEAERLALAEHDALVARGESADLAAQMEAQR